MSAGCVRGTEDQRASSESPKLLRQTGHDIRRAPCSHSSGGQGLGLAPARDLGQGWGEARRTYFDRYNIHLEITV